MPFNAYLCHITILTNTYLYIIHAPNTSPTPHHLSNTLPIHTTDLRFDYLLHTRYTHVTNRYISVTYGLQHNLDIRPKTSLGSGHALSGKQKSIQGTDARELVALDAANGFLSNRIPCSLRTK